MTSTAAADEPIRVGREVYATDGTKLGTIATVYPPAGNSDETWIAVDAGVSDGAYLVPCDGAGLFSEGLQVNRSVEEVQGSPHVVVRDELSDAALAELGDYYGLAQRTSLIPGASQADEMPAGQSAPQRPPVQSHSVPVGSRSTDDRTDDHTDSVDRQPSPGAVTVSGADGDVDLAESDELRTSRAEAREAAGYDDGTGVATRDRVNPSQQE